MVCVLSVFGVGPVAQTQVSLVIAQYQVATGGCIDGGMNDWLHKVK